MDKRQVKKLVVTNPGVNAEQLGEVRRLLKGLRAQGVRGSGYNLKMPYEPNLANEDYVCPTRSRKRR